MWISREKYNEMRAQQIADEFVFAVLSSILDTYTDKLRQQRETIEELDDWIEELLNVDCNLADVCPWRKAGPE